MFFNYQHKYKKVKKMLQIVPLIKNKSLEKKLKVSVSQKYKNVLSLSGAGNFLLS